MTGVQTCALPISGHAEIPAAVLFDKDQVVKPGQGAQFAVFPALHELNHQASHPCAGGAQDKPQGGARLALAVSRVYVNITL